MRVLFLCVLLALWGCAAVHAYDTENEESPHASGEFDEFQVRSAVKPKECRAEIVLKQLAAANAATARERVSRIRTELTALRKLHDKQQAGRVKDLLKELKIEEQLVVPTQAKPTAPYVFHDIEDNKEDCQRVQRIELVRCIMQADAINRLKNKICLTNDKLSFSDVRKLPEYVERHGKPLEKALKKKMHKIVSKSLKNQFGYVNKSLKKLRMFSDANQALADEDKAEDAMIKKVSVSRKIKHVKHVSTSSNNDVEADEDVAKRGLMDPCDAMRNAVWKMRRQFMKANPCPLQYAALNNARTDLKFARGKVSAAARRRAVRARRSLLRCYMKKLSRAKIVKMAAKETKYQRAKTLYNSKCRSKAKKLLGGKIVDGQQNQMCALVEKCKEVNERELQGAKTVQAKYRIERRIAADARLLRECLQQHKTHMQKEDNLLKLKLKNDKEKEKRVKEQRIRIENVRKTMAYPSKKVLADAVRAEAKEKKALTRVIKETKEYLVRKAVLKKIKMELDWSIVHERRRIIKSMGPCAQKKYQEKVFRWKLEDRLRHLSMFKLKRTFGECKRWVKITQTKANVCVRTMPLKKIKKCMLKQKALKLRAKAVCPDAMWDDFPDPSYDNLQPSSRLMVCTRQNGFLKDAVKECERVSATHTMSLKRCTTIQGDLNKRVRAHCSRKMRTNLGVSKRGLLDVSANKLKKCHERNYFLLAALKHCLHHKKHQSHFKSVYVKYSSADKKKKNSASNKATKPARVGRTRATKKPSISYRLKGILRCANGGARVGGARIICLSRRNGRRIRKITRANSKGIFNLRLVGVSACLVRGRGFSRRLVKNLRGPANGSIVHQVLLRCSRSIATKKPVKKATKKPVASKKPVVKKASKKPATWFTLRGIVHCSGRKTRVHDAHILCVSRHNKRTRRYTAKTTTKGIFALRLPGRAICIVRAKGSRKKILRNVSGKAGSRIVRRIALVCPKKKKNTTAAPATKKPRAAKTQKGTFTIKGVTRCTTAGPMPGVLVRCYARVGAKWQKMQAFSTAGGRFVIKNFPIVKKSMCVAVKKGYKKTVLKYIKGPAGGAVVKLFQLKKL